MPGSRRKGENSTILTLQALIDFTLSLYSGSPTLLSPPTTSALADGIERFLRHQLSFADLIQIGFSLTGSVVPLERLKTIVDTPPDALPPASTISGKTRRASRAWTQYEDQRLLAGIYHHGIENWTLISKYVGNGRTRSQCSQRWYRGLNPKIRKDQWSPDEENRLMALVREHGEKSWTAIASLLGNRSDVQCRYRYFQLQKGGTEQRPAALGGQIEMGIEMRPMEIPESLPIPLASSMEFKKSDSLFDSNLWLLPID
jgi:hypothetical protein